jgi:hypothetical protein
MTKELFSGFSETPWEWACARRKWFKTPGRDAIAGLGMGALSGGIRYLSADGNWMAASLVGVSVSLVGTLLFCRIEALYWLLLRNRTLLMEANKRIRELERAGESIASGSLEAAAKSGMLRTGLAMLLVEYEKMERQFMTKEITQELRNDQTRLHNIALPIIEKGLGVDYWAQFKSEQEVPPSMPPSFNQQESWQDLRLLCAIHGRKKWLSRTIEGLKVER